MGQKYIVVFILLLITLATLVTNALALAEINNNEAQLLEVVKSYQAYNNYLVNKANELEAELDYYHQNCRDKVDITIEEIPTPTN